MAKRNKLSFDPHSFNFGRVKRDWKPFLKGLLTFVSLTFAVFVLLCAFKALLFNSATERRLYRENRIYSKVLAEMEERQENLKDVISALQYKDNAIYEQVFKSNAPNVNPMGISFSVSDTIPDSRLVRNTSDRADALLKKSARIEENFRKIAQALSEPDRELPPMTMPLKDISYPQVGASVGERMNPYLNASVRHSGLDLITSPGVEVYAPADGEVVESRALTGNMGTIVRIRHAEGYETLFAHLGTRYVSKGQKVKLGQRIGTVGMTGNAYAPHLHYEIYLNGVMEDPINHFFASVSPEEYANMFYMSSSTKQSMD